MFSDPTTGLSATLQSFSQAIQTMANSPSQSSTRQAVLNQAQAVISQFQSYQSNFEQLGGQVNTQLQSQASTITSLAQSIASLNQSIMAAQNNGSSQPPNSLLDQRNNLIDQLSQDVGVTTTTQSDGSVSVFIGSGQALVVGAQAATLSATPDQFKSDQLDLSLTSSTSSSDITSELTGGTLGGLLQFRSQMLIPGENALGQAAVTLTNLLNTQNEAGLDQNGNIGGALLAVGGPQVLTSQDNTRQCQRYRGDQQSGRIDHQQLLSAVRRRQLEPDRYRQRRRYRADLQHQRRRDHADGGGFDAHGDRHRPVGRSVSDRADG